MSSMYKERLREAMRAVEEQYRDLGYTVFFIALNGSQNYELDIHSETYDSDYDYYCVVIPDLQRLISSPELLSEQMDYQGGHIKVKDVRQFAKELEKQNPSTIEVALTHHKVDGWGYFYLETMEEAVKNNIKKDPYMLIKSTVGSFYSRLNRMCKLTEKTQWIIDRDGYDGKSACLAYRMYCILLDLCNGDPFCLVQNERDRDVMMKLKLNQYSEEMALHILNSVTRHLEECILPKLNELYPSVKDKDYRPIISLANEIVYSHCTR